MQHWRPDCVLVPSRTNFFSIFNVANAGDHVVSSSAIYGGTFNLFAVTMKKMGIDFTFVSPDCTEEELRKAYRNLAKRCHPDLCQDKDNDFQPYRPRH